MPPDESWNGLRPAGLVVPDVKITVTNTDTQDTRKATRTRKASTSCWACPSQLQGVRRHAGFSKVNSAEQKAAINNRSASISRWKWAPRVRPSMSVPGCSVETVQPNSGQSITGRALTNMPLNGPTCSIWLLLQPGVTESNDDNGGAGSTASPAARTDSVTFLLDGGNNNACWITATLLDPNPDAIAIPTADQRLHAEYGRNGGGIISIVTSRVPIRSMAARSSSFEPGLRRQRLLQ